MDTVFAQFRFHDERNEMHHTFEMASTSVATYAVLTLCCFGSESLGAKLHACASCWETSYTKGFSMPYPKVSLNLAVLCLLLCSLEHPPLTEKMDGVALSNAAFRGPGWIACKR